MIINPIDHNFHDGEGGFREQMFVLYPAGFNNGFVTMIRSHILTCKPSMAGFDPDAPGENTMQGWTNLESLIENDGVRGTFHTHPQGALDFSSHDFRTQCAIARAQGSMYLWHGVQSLHHETAHFVCMHLLGGSHIHVYDLGWISTSVDDMVVHVPAPPKVSKLGSGIYRWEI